MAKKISNQIITGFLNIFGHGASSVQLTVKGAESQTVALQEWQNSNGTTLASLKSTGEFQTILIDGGSA